MPGGTPPDEVTIAVKVTEEPKLDGFGDPIRVVVVAAAPTDSMTAALVLEANATLPSYEAVTVWLPVASALVVSDA